MLLIGSRALIENGFELKRYPKDTDYICTYEEYSTWISDRKPDLASFYPVSSNKFVAFHGADCNKAIYEFEIAWPGSTAEELLALQAGRHFVSPEVCLALKLSHRYLRNSPAFLKTMEDIHMLRRAGITIQQGTALSDWLVRREKETYSYAHPNLNQSKKGFFDASVKYVYDHDSIHKSVAYGNIPAYRLYMEDGAEVNCSKDKFFNKISRVTRLCGVAEEAYVLAIERSLVPHKGVLTPKQAFDLALMKVCTSITSGWFREFAWEHYYMVQSIYSPEYANKFWADVALGKIPLAEKTVDKAGM